MITMEHDNGSIWQPATKKVNGVTCFVLSNKNPLNHVDKVDGTPERGNEERFHIHCPDERSVLNGLQSGLSIRMTGTGDNGSSQNNLFVGEQILFDGVQMVKAVR